MPQTVLVVEDNPLNMKLIGSILEFLKLDCVCAENGKMGFALAQHTRPDLILMDMQLPDISGLDVVALIKGEDSLRHIPIIALTAFAMKGDAEKFLAGGCDAYLAKPFNMPDFMATVQKHLPQEKAA
jgi:two-component system, cell cycle response regulator DivK